MQFREGLVSIGLPVYNGENYLAEAVASLLAQSYTNFELIISDNASTDGTEAICRKFAAADSRVRYVRNADNLGAAWNHNRTVALARGEYFKLASHDDLCEPAFLQRCVEVLERDPDVVLAYPRSRMLTPLGGLWMDHDYHDDLDTACASACRRFGQLIHEELPGFRVFGVARMANVRAIPGFGNHQGSDKIWLYRMALQGRFEEVPEVLFSYRWHGQQATRLRDDAPAFYAWWDPRQRGRRVFANWRLLRELLLSVSGAPIGLRERACCLGEVARWARARRGALGRELGLSPRRANPGQAG